MKNEIESCLICGEELEYFPTDKEMECYYCHKKFMSKAACRNGHYVCDECHSSAAIRHIYDFCLHAEGRNPVEIAVAMMRDESIHMHGPENHVLVGSALLAAYHNAGGDIDLRTALGEMAARGKKVPGGVCGFWGCCGAATSVGMFYSIVSGATPLTTDTWGASNLITASALAAIGRVGGPRCCKRNAFLAIGEAVDFVAARLGVQMDVPQHFACEFSTMNRQCIGARCPFHAADGKTSFGV